MLISFWLSMHDAGIAAWNTKPSPLDRLRVTVMFKGNLGSRFRG